MTSVPTGALDATSFLDLGRTFTANMTGNVLLLAFSLTGTSLGGGSSTRGFAVAGRRSRPARLPAALAVEVLLVAATLGWTVTGSVEETWRRNVVVALLALATGVQNAIFRRMSVAEANTTVLTTRLGSPAADVVAVAGHPPSGPGAGWPQWDASSSVPCSVPSFSVTMHPGRSSWPLRSSARRLVGRGVEPGWMARTGRLAATSRPAGVPRGLRTHRPGTDRGN